MYKGRYRNIIILFLVSVLGLIARYPLRDIVSHDAMGYLLPWYEEIKINGGLHALSQQVGNYNIPYQFLIALMTYLPIKPLYAYKLLSILFDYLLAAGLAVLVYDALKEPEAVRKLHSKSGGESGNQQISSGDAAYATVKKEGGKAWQAAILTYTLSVLSVIVIMNSSAWAQCDSIYTAFLIWSVVYLERKRYTAAYIFAGLAFSFKLQAVFLVPFYLYHYARERSHTILHFLWIPVMMFLTSLPGILMGRSPMAFLSIYLEQTGGIHMYSEYPSFWMFLPDREGGLGYPEYYKYKSLAMIFTVVLLAGILCYMLKKPREAVERRRIEGMLRSAMVLSFTCVYFLPCMTDRYGYLYEMLAIPLAVLDTRTVPYFIVLHLLMYYVYGGRLGAEMLPIRMQAAACILFVLWLLYVVRYKEAERYSC